MKAIYIHKDEPEAKLFTGKIYDVETSDYNEDAYDVEGITPFFIGVIEYQGVAKKCFSTLSEIEESSLDHWEKIPESITTLIQLPC